MDSTGAEFDPVTGCCKQGNKIPCIIKDGKFLQKGRNKVVDLRYSLSNILE
jgi:hypothetical protein